MQRDTASDPDFPPNLDYKWSFIRGQRGNDETLTVIEDTGSLGNWISAEQVQRLGLQRISGPLVEHQVLTGHKFVTYEYVSVPWEGRNCSGTSRFYVTPTGAPGWVQMIVGKEFLAMYPDVFWDEEPVQSRMLLAVQPKLKVNC